jgi:hypothetical protein
MGRILPRPSGTALAQLACATRARPMAWLAQPYVVACAHSRTWPGACAVVAAALAMAARLIHGQRAPPMTRGLTKSTTRRRERRGAHFGVSPPQARTETVAHRGFGGGNARKPHVALASSNAAAARLWRSTCGGEQREDSGQH